MLTKNVFEKLKDFDLFTLKYHIFYHILEGVSRFSALNFLDASSFEHFSYVIKKFIMKTSMQRSSTLEEAVKLTNALVAIQIKRNNTSRRIGKEKFFRDGKIINLIEIATSTLESLAHIDKAERGVPASQC